MLRAMQILLLQCAVALTVQAGDAAASGTTQTNGQKLSPTAKPVVAACHKSFWVQGKGQASVNPPCPPINPIDAQEALAAAQADAIAKQPGLYVCPAECPTLSRGQWSTKGTICTTGKRLTVLLIGGYEFSCD